MADAAKPLILIAYRSFENVLAAAMQHQDERLSLYTNSLKFRNNSRGASLFQPRVNLSA
jgi:hypothetical protein